MIHVDACPVPAQMIEFHTIRDGPFDTFINPPMSINRLSFDAKLSIARSSNVACPDNAIAHIAGIKLESLNIRKASG